VGPSGVINPSTTQTFLNFLGISAWDSNTTESLFQFYCLAAGTWRNMACYIRDPNNFNRTTTVTNRITDGNGSRNGSMAISVPAFTPGYFEDIAVSTDYDTVSVGNLLDYGVVASSNGSGGFEMTW